MRTLLPILTLLCAVALSAQAQPEQSGAATPAALTSAETAAFGGVVQPAPGVGAEYSVIARDAHSRTWQRVELEPTRSGRSIPHVHAYKEMCTGMHYLDPQTGRWTESQELVEAVPGGAIARHGQIQVIFANNLATAGAIDLQTPDGKRLTSNVTGLSYFDAASGTNILIASVKDCQGQILPPNRVIYEDAFDGLNASVCFTYTRGGFEQDIILEESPASPEACGLNSATTRLVVMTEFLDPPQPALQTSVVTDGDGAPMQDDTLDFGALHFGPGTGVLLGTNATGAGLRIFKQWAELEGRRFLLEQVPAVDVRKAMSLLPGKQGASLESTTKAIRFTASTRQLPTPRPAKADTNAMLLASHPLAQTGFLLDYVTMVASATNYTFQGDTTYYISGSVTLAGTNTWEGGAVLKFAANAGLFLARPYNINPQIVFQTKSYSPVVFTAKDDNSLGETISGSTGNPSGYYANPALSLTAFSGTQFAAHLRVAYAQQGFSLVGVTLNLSDAQFVNCRSGFQFGGASLLLRNALFANTRTNFNSSGGASIDAQNVTFSGSTRLASNTSQYPDTSLTVTNGIFANVTNLNTANVQLSGSYNGFFNTTQFGASTFTNAGYPFQTVGAGAFYLADNSVFRNVGTTNIDSTLLADLRQKTTYPPIVYSNVTITTDTVLGPQAHRDTDAPDLGYHFFPLDYTFGGVTANANVTFTPGTAVGWFRTSSGWYHAGHGIHAGDDTTITFNGTLEQPDYWVRCNTVQEQPAYAGYGPGGITGWTYPSVNDAPKVVARFTYCSALTFEAGATHFRDDWGILKLEATDCQFMGAGVGGYNVLYSITNCLYSRCQIWLSTGEPFPTMVIRNCTVHGSSLGFSHGEPGPAHFYTSIRDTIFDGTIINTGYPNDPACVDYNYNAFLTGSSRTNPQGASDKVVTSFNWQTSWLGNYYLPSDSLLVDAGSTTPDAVGLYHYTTQTNQLKDTSAVDIGYHYVAVDGNGNPLDTDGDGIPDYLEDANGNGTVDSGETDWQNAADAGLKVWITEPKRSSNLP